MILRWYYLFVQPTWVLEFEEWSEIFMAKCHGSWNYWLGTIFFGMRAWYPEYELLEGYRDK